MNTENLDLGWRLRDRRISEMRLIDADYIKIRLCEIADYWRSKGKRYEAVLLNDTVNAVIDSEPTITQPSGEWISVKDRLPDKPGHYLVCTSINYWHGGCMDKNEEHKYHDSGTPIGYDGTMMSVLDCYYDITGDWNRVFNKHVTHWMPLPEPPEEKESVR